MDVIFYEAFQEEEDVIKKFLPKNISARFTWKTIQEEGEKKHPAEIISIRTQSRIPSELGGNIKGILTRSQGYDHLISFRRESQEDIAYGYLDNYCARAVAEQAVLMMMALFRKLKKQISQFTAFKRDGLTGQECRGRNALVIGVGNIGSEIVDIVKGLRMHAKGIDIAPALEDLEYVTLKEGLSWAEVVFCAVPLTEKTKGMLNYDVFKSAKKGTMFINIARGEISPVQDLKRLISEGILGGIALDVYPQEDLLANGLRMQQSINTDEGQAILKLAEEDQVLFTPHNAFNTLEALEQKASLSAASVVSFLEKGTFPHPIPVP